MRCAHSLQKTRRKYGEKYCKVGKVNGATKTFVLPFHRKSDFRKFSQNKIDKPLQFLVSHMLYNVLEREI